MSDYDQIGNAAMAMYRLAMAGVVAMFVLAIIAGVGLIGGLVWLFYHVTIS